MIAAHGFYSWQDFDKNSASRDPPGLAELLAYSLMNGSQSINQSINQDFNSRWQTATRQGKYANMN